MVTGVSYIWGFIMIISASRRTDIPSYYSKWFMNRIHDGFVYVKNPVNPKQISKVSLSPDVVDCIVFWSKNPEPMLNELKDLSNYKYYFQFSITPYSKDVECNLPNKGNSIIPTFRRLSDMIGPEKVIWRYDPILVNGTYTIGYHIKYFEAMAKRLSGYTEKVTISFLDYYTKISRALTAIGVKDITEEDKHKIAGEFSKIADYYNLRIDTCAEDIDLSAYGIGHAKCIDDKLIERILQTAVSVDKDKNQRQACGCVSSIDIGAYDTCMNGCRYCYANNSDKTIKNKINKYDVNSPLLCDEVKEDDIVKSRKMESLIVKKHTLY